MAIDGSQDVCSCYARVLSTTSRLEPHRNVNPMAGQAMGNPLGFQGELPRHRWQDIELAVAGDGGRHSVAGHIADIGCVGADAGVGGWVG